MQTDVIILLLWRNSTLTVKIEQVPLLDIIWSMPQKTFTMIISEAIQDPVHNEPMIYRSILFAQKAQVSVRAKHQKGISCNPRRAWERTHDR